MEATSTKQYLPPTCGSLGGVKTYVIKERLLDVVKYNITHRTVKFSDSTYYM